MLTPIEQYLDSADTTKPSYGFKLNAKFEKQTIGKRATFEFVSPMGINLKKTTIPAAIGCLIVSESGNVSRDKNGDCAYYWSGSLGWKDVLAKQHQRQ